MSNFVIRPVSPLMVILLTAMLLTLPGCGYFQTAESDDADEFAELDGEKKGDKATDRQEMSSSDGAAEGELELKLKVGERFPMQKRIEQILTQSLGQGTTVNRSLLELMLTLQVEEIREGKRLLSVQYNRVQYGHYINGKTVKYNSDSSERIPVEALVYAGLKGNGFQFWIGSDNRVVELVGFSEFLQRCLRDVPPQYREAVLRQLETTHSEEGLANFVDDGIGMLPNPNTSIKVGKGWDLKPRHTESPVPMSISTRCVLKNLTETSAQISLMGEITGSNLPTIVPDGARNMKIIVNGGVCNGVCTVDRRTGLPTHSEVNRSLQMTVTLPDGSEIRQKKEIQTSISAFPVQGEQMLLGGGNHNIESNAVSQSGMGHDYGSGRVTQAGGSSPGRERRDSSSTVRGDADLRSSRR